MEAAVKAALGTKIFKPTGSSGGGSISEGAAYFTDNGTVFVKVNNKEKAKLMFDGERAGLNAILRTKTIRVPKPIEVVSFPGRSTGGAALVMEYFKFGSRSADCIQAKLGEQLARLHLHNGIQLVNLQKEESRINHSQESEDEVEGEGPVHEFGFNFPTCCGYIPLDNAWNTNWTTFYIRQRLQPRVDNIVKEYGSRELTELWNKCLPNVEKKLNRVKDLTPSLLHGDLWSGNFDACDNEPVIFDPATFFGHHEFDLGIGYMFGGFGKSFHESYHRLVPKSEGFDERRDIYELFHHLNHWNHFGDSYKNSSLRLMRNI